MFSEIDVMTKVKCIPFILDRCFLTFPSQPLQCSDTLNTTTWKSIYTRSPSRSKEHPEYFWCILLYSLNFYYAYIYSNINT